MGFWLAAGYLRRFQRQQRGSQNPMDLSQIRDAAVASEFPSRAALDQWLARAVGPHRALLDKALYHTGRALQLCPLQGQGYLYLADLCFLQGSPAAASEASAAASASCSGVK